jgi:hypothetical protein
MPGNIGVVAGLIPVSPSFTARVSPGYLPGYLPEFSPVCRSIQARFVPAAGGRQVPCQAWSMIGMFRAIYSLDHTRSITMLL